MALKKNVVGNIAGLKAKIKASQGKFDFDTSPYHQSMKIQYLQ